jgi:hypothetical protein
VRAGYSFDTSDYAIAQQTGSYNNVPFPRDAADDNYNSFDPFPIGHTGEVGDGDLFDASGSLLMPLDRMRRFLTPIDINGTGQVRQWTAAPGSPDRGGDNYGRVEYFSYFRPPGSPGTINFSQVVPQTYGAITYGTWNYATGVPTPWFVGAPYQPDVTNNPLHGFEAFRFPNQNYAAPFLPQALGGSPFNQNVGANGVPMAFPTYDVHVNTQARSDGLNEADEMNLYTLNPLLDSPYGPSDLEWLYRQQDVDGNSLSSRLQTLAPISFTNGVDGLRRRRLFALDAWETNSFVWANDNPGGVFPNNSRFASNPVATQPNPAYAGGTPRINVANTGFDSLSAILTSTLPPGTSLHVPTPSLAHRGKKINLNYPLPVSNDSNEPIRQKWISDTYQLLKWVLPPESVDTPEELAQLSQFVINIVDFRDPDCTMTHWINPDVLLSGVPQPAAGAPTVGLPANPLQLIAKPAGAANPVGTIALDQYGMEYNPVALNETLAYSFQYRTAATATPTQWNRFLVELVNTMTIPEVATTGTGTGQVNATAISLGGFNYTAGDPYSGGCWDMVFTGDDPYSRPDPYRGQLPIYGNIYGLIPLNRDSFLTTFPGNRGAPPSSDVVLQPLLPGNTGAGGGITINQITYNSANNAGGVPAPILGTGAALDSNYFYVFGNMPASTGTGATATSYENGPLQPGYYYSNTGATATTTGTQQFVGTVNGYRVPANTPAVIQSLNATAGYDPVNGTVTPNIQLYPGVLPGIAGPTTSGGGAIPVANFLWKVPYPKLGGTGAPVAPIYYWVCLRRPANPFAPVGVNNPMVVVDAVRMPMVDGTGATITMDAQGNPGATGQFNTVYSAQRLQPYRGGHAVPPPTPGGVSPALDVRYGYSEQIASPTANSVGGYQTQGIYFQNANANPPIKYASTFPIYHTLGWANENATGSVDPTMTPGAVVEAWDHFPFHDRDFSSVAELTLVPGCPPGLLTKQFAEFAPSQINATSIFTGSKGRTTPTFPSTGPGAPTNVGFPWNFTSVLPLAPVLPLAGTAGAAVDATIPLQAVSTGTPVQPHSVPYLSDKFFYSAFGGGTGGVSYDTGGLVGGYAADGWFKMFEVFEVPSQMLGSIGPAAAGANFDWARQDSKPGLLNLNLIIDEEVFFSVAGEQSISQQNGQSVDGGGAVRTAANPTNDQFSQQLLNSDQVPPLAPGNYTAALGTLPLAAGSSPIPMVVTSVLANGSPASAYPLASQGFLTWDPVYNYLNQTVAPTAPPLYSNALKAAWVQFLSLRHGGSGYLFGYGGAAVGQNAAVNPQIPNLTAGYGVGIPAERPFHGLTYPDIDYTVMRPAALPPSAFTTPVANVPASAAALAAAPNTYTSDPGVRNPYLSWAYPPSAAFPAASGPGYGYTAVGGAGTPVVLPPPIPVRRLFQVPDAYNPSPGVAPGATVTAASNASDAGDPYYNYLALVPNPPLGGALPVPAAGALPPIPATQYLNTAPPSSMVLTNSVVNLYWPGASAGTSYSTVGGAAAPIAVTTLQGFNTNNPYLGARSTGGGAGGGPVNVDAKQHPYWRSEQLQRIMNLTTVRTHQYAVWITIGFFEVKRQGDIGMIGQGRPDLAYDTLGPEVGAVTGEKLRYRGFFLVDRLRLPGFDPGNIDSFRSAVVYRKVIQ